MNSFRKTLSVRKKKSPEHSDNSKPQLWIDDERKIKEGSCSFQVKYLGCIEVFESRGMQVCVEAIRALRKSKKKVQRAILYVSGDALRVSDEISKHLIVDQTIEKVSFCAPDRSHDKGFAYICRDGATRRWMCHAFLAVKESGERLSHAVGCAFAICLEKKQKRERDAVQVSFSTEDAMFSRMSSFRHTTLSERLLDPQAAIVVEQSASVSGGGGLGVGVNASQAGDNSEGSGAIVLFGASSPLERTATLPKLGSGAIPRPRASQSMIVRQTSSRLFPKLQEASPFKSAMSARAEDTAPGQLQRTNGMLNGETIEEETGSDVDDQSTPNGGRGRFPSSSLDPSSSYAFPNQAVDMSPETSQHQQQQMLQLKPSQRSPKFPVDFSAPFEIAAPFVTTVDPFSAAPFNPATIQQMRTSHLQETNGLSPQLHRQPISETFHASGPASDPTLAAWIASTNQLTSVNPDNLFPVAAMLHPPENTANHPSSSPKMFGQSSPESATQRNVQPGLPFEVTSHHTSPFGLKTMTTSVGGFTTSKPRPNPLATWDTPTVGPRAPWVPGQLPPEPTTFADDPFDLGWADRVTAMANHQLATSALQGAPNVELMAPQDALFNTSPVFFGVPPFSTSVTEAYSPTVSSTNPFLNPLLTNIP